MVRQFLANNKTVLALKTVDRSAGTVEGESIDTKGFGEMTAIQQAGLTSGTPSSFSSNVSWEESDDETSWSAVTGVTLNSLITADAIESGDITLRDKFAKRYIRPSQVLAFVGGSTPTLNSGVVVILSDANVLPV